MIAAATPTKPTDRLKLFISYSRADAIAADALTSALESHGFEIKIDRRDLPYGEEWQAELTDFIRGSDTVLWLVSPDSLKSRWCNWELGETGRFNKRLVPVVVRIIARDDLPQSLGKIHLLPAEGIYNSEDHLSVLVAALEMDRDWLKEATRLADRARDWMRGQRSGSLLLRGAGLRAAESWSSKQPKSAPMPGSDVLEFILASRRGAAARQRWIVGAAVAIAIAGVSLSGIAWRQRNIAIEQRNRALTTQSRFLADLSNQQFNENDFGSALLVALEGMADSAEGSTRPWVPESEAALFRSLQELHETAVLEGHKDQLSSAVFSPDGERALTASRDGTTKIWNIATREPIATLVDSSPTFIWSANFSPDGHRIVTATYNGGATIWSSDTGKPIVRLVVDDGDVWDATFSPDGKRVLTAGAVARIWDAETGKPVTILNGHAGPVLDASFSPDSRSVVTASADKTARIWDAGTGKQLSVLKGHGGQVFSAKFSPDGRKIVTASADKSVRVWDRESGSEIYSYTGHGEEVYSAAFDSEGRRIVTASRDKTSHVVDLDSGQLTVLAGHVGTVWTAVFGPDGKSVLTASEDGTARIWRMTPDREYDDVESVAFSSDSRRILTGLRDGAAKIWDVRSGDLVATLVGHSGGILAASFSSDDQRIVTASADLSARVWTLDDGKTVAATSIDAGAASTSFAANGPRVLTQSPDKLRIVDPTTGALISEIAHPSDSLGGASWDGSLSLDGRRVATTRLGSDVDPIYVWDAGASKETGEFKGPNGPAYKVAISPDGSRVAGLGFEDRTAKIWDTETGKLIATLRLSQRGGALSFSPDARRIAIAASELQIWDIESGKPLASFDVLRTGDVRRIEFSPDGRWLATISGDNVAHLWQIFTTGDELVARAKERVPRCLTGQQRVGAFLDLEPPAWCAEMAKWMRSPGVLMSKWKFH